MGRVRRGHARGGGPCAVPDSGSSCFQMWWAGRMRLSGPFSPRSVVGMTAGGSGASARARRWSPGLAQGRAVLPARAVPVPGCPDLLRGPGACWSARGALPKRSGSADPRAARAGREGIGLFVRRRAVARATRAVVLRCARSYPGALLTYDPASQGTTPRHKVRHRAKRYDRAPRRTTRRPDVRPRRTRTHRTTSTRPPPPTHRRCPSRPHPRTRRTSIPDGAERSAGTGTVFSSSPRTRRRGSLRGRRGRGASIVTSIFGRAVPPGPARARGVLAVPAVPARRPVLAPRGAHEADHNE